MSLELLLGPMFAGKSSTILGVLRRNALIQRPTFCITNRLDKRYSLEPRIVTHNQESYPATAVSELVPTMKTKEFLESQCVIIEEAQFFPDLLSFVLEAVEVHKKEVICVGLDGDSDRKPFGQLIDLVPYADKITKLNALCSHCRDGTAAIFTYRKPGISSENQVTVGSDDKYEALCRHHYLAATIGKN